jgi:hypothetical protein
LQAAGFEVTGARLSYAGQAYVLAARKRAA